MKLRSILSAFFLFIPLCLFSDIGGHYTMNGTSISGSRYHGTAVIHRRADSVYQATWTFSDGTVDIGTGVRKGDFLSFVFQEPIGDGAYFYGVIQYKIENDKLVARYVGLNGTQKGYETLKKR